MIKITFSNTKDVAGIYYPSTRPFTGKLYLDADIGRPTYIYNEDGEEDINGNFNRSFARVEKQYNIRTHLLEHMVDAFAVIQLHDYINVLASNGANFIASEFRMSEPEWDENIPCLAEVTLTFNVYSDSTFTRC